MHEAIALNPRDDWAQTKRGNVLLDLDRKQEALAAFEAATAIRPGNADAAAFRYWTFCRLGRPEEADAAFFETIRRTPNAERLIAKYVDEHRDRDPQEAALKLIATAAALGTAECVPPSIGLLLAAARLFEYARKPHRALATLEGLYSEQPQECGAYIRGIELADRLGKRAHVERYALLGLSSLPTPHLELIEWLINDTSSHWTDKLIKTRKFRRGITRCRNESDLRELAARCLTRAAAKEAGRFSPAVLAVRVAIVDLHRPKLRCAREILDKVLELRPGDIPALTVLAAVAIAAGDSRTALDCLQRTRRGIVEGEADRWHERACAAHLLANDLARAEEAARGSWRKNELATACWTDSVRLTCRRMALAHARKGHREEAKVWLARYAKLAPWSERQRLRWHMLLARFGLRRSVLNV